MKQRDESEIPRPVGGEELPIQIDIEPISSSMNALVKKSISLVWIFLLLFSAIQNSEANGQKSNWRLKNRLQLGLEGDDNIFEARSHLTADQSLKLMFQSQGYRRSPKYQFQFSYMGGYQGYWHHSRENKLINEIEGEFGVHLTSGFSIGGNTQARVKIFINEELDYGLGRAGLFLQALLPLGVTSRCCFNLHGLDYASYSFFDFQGTEWGLQLNRNLGHSFSGQGGFYFQNLRFERNASTYHPVNLYPILLHQKQSDKIYEVAVHGQYQQGLLLNLGYTYERYRSNSYGFSYNKHQIILLLAQRLYFNWLLRMYATLQKKTYLEPLAPFIPLELDSEREESNFLVLDLSWEMSSEFTLLLRMAWYDNESPLRARYYQKRLATLGLEYQF